MLTSDGRPLDLARFQVSATRRIRSELDAARTSATIVCAGTGSGKTKAFYLPVLSALAADGDQQRWARVLALYPRNELLKDQLTEALSQVEMIAAAGGPVLSIGAFFGPTASSARYVREDADGEGRGWKMADGNGYACRYLRCPRRCPNDLVWPREAFAAGEEILRCPRCGWQSRPHQIVLTRDHLFAAPPHLLFTTTEMLNRGLADERIRPLVLGSTPARRPRALLLDEVHTYGGPHGAQVALLLRRWRAALGRNVPLHVVGLSATLEQPAKFFAQLTDLDDVVEIRPGADEARPQGAEYAVVLRGNPVSGRALLSTTIQTIFLTARLLESQELRERTGTSGSRVFAFTDNLDVTNRLFWDLSSAEGLGGSRGPLAQLRSVANADVDAQVRDQEGQIWRLPPRLGWPLDAAHRLRVSRTSSQDAGVDPLSNVIVATSSLEVGFDDPEVGAVVQHKAPRDDAAFIQRKGRAGRQVDMRPWTVVVLSDYGRDRVRYQAYESLFAPVLAPRTLPVDNIHILKMQGAYALLDWLTQRVPALRSRYDLTRQRASSGRVAQQQRAVIAELRGVLEEPRRERDLARHLQTALALSPEQTTAVLWSSPRALMTSVIPTLLRRLEANWVTIDGGLDGLVSDLPLPEHAPQALFSDLNLPEVNVVAPRRRGGAPYESSMSVVQALSEFVPGRASRRFGGSYRDWHWVPRPEPDEDGTLSADTASWAPDVRADGVLEVPGELQPRALLRPWTMNLDLIEAAADQSSNAQPRWTTNIRARSPAFSVTLPGSSGAARVIAELGFHSHAAGNEVEVARGVTRVVAEVDGIEVDIELIRSHDGQTTPVALGFVAAVDAVRVRVPQDALPSFAALPPRAQRALRTSWFTRALAKDDALRARLGPFTIGWVATLYLASIAGIALGDGLTSLAAAIARVKELGIARCLTRALEAVFVVGDDESEEEGRGVGRLREALADGAVVERVEEIGRALGALAAEDLDAHAQAVTLTTVGAAVREAFQRMAPTFDVDALIIDVSSAGDGDGFDVWLCEPDVGSGGTIEELRLMASADPRRLGRLLEAAVGPTQLELVDWNVREVMALAASSPDMEAAFAAVRGATNGEAATEAQRALRAALRAHGLPVEHGVLATLNLRVLRAGSTLTTDQALVDALEMWERAEGDLAIELDARSIAYAMSRACDLTLEQIYSLLWPRGRDARAAGLDAYTRFARLEPPDRLTLAESFRDQTLEVPLSPTAIDAVRAALAETGVARLSAPLAQAEELQRLVTTMLTEGIDVGSVTGYARIVAATRGDDAVGITLELPEGAA
jgi:hypothetical protein